MTRGAQRPGRAGAHGRARAAVLHLAGRLVAGFALGAVAYVAVAQPTYPAKPIRLVSPLPPGGGNDILARLVAQKVTEAWPQPMIVENRPGAGMVVGTEHVAKSAPDGYTLVLVGIGNVINASLLPRIPYDIIKDFAPVASLAAAEQVLAVHPAVPATTLQEFVALAKAKPGALNYSSAGNGTLNNLSAEFFNMLAGIRTQHIPYKGTAPALADLVGGQVQMSLSPVNSAIPYLRNGRLRGLAVTGESRLAALPQVPTFAEAGMPAFNVRGWYGISAPAGTPPDVIAKLGAEFRRILAMPDVRERLVGLGMEPFVSSPEAFAALMKADLARYAEVIRAANIKSE